MLSPRPCHVLVDPIILKHSQRFNTKFQIVFDIKKLQLSLCKFTQRTIYSKNVSCFCCLISLSVEPIWNRAAYSGAGRWSGGLVPLLLKENQTKVIAKLEELIVQCCRNVLELMTKCVQTDVVMLYSVVFIVMENTLVSCEPISPAPQLSAMPKPFTNMHYNNPLTHPESPVPVLMFPFQTIKIKIWSIWLSLLWYHQLYSSNSCTALYYSTLYLILK